MNLLESMLSLCNANEYVDNFRKHEIDIYTLKFLQDDDLKIIGVNDDTKRQAILKHAANLQVDTELFENVTISNEYIEGVLRQMSTQLRKHSASLAIAIQRKDVIICDAKLTPAVGCLKRSAELLRNELSSFEKKILVEKRQRSQKSRLLIKIGLTGCLLLLSYQVYKNLRM